MQLKILDQTFAILKLPPTDPIPSWAWQGEVFSVTRTDEELSIVCPSECLPDNERFEYLEKDWKCLKVEGILDFTQTGILSSLAKPLADNRISIFAVSTYNTDYLLIKSRFMDQARAVLEKEGHTFCKERSPRA
jgi:hypothetical protein